VRLGRGADDGAVDAVKGGFGRQRDLGPGEVLGRRLALSGGGIVGGEGLDPHRAEVAEVAAADRTQSKDGDLHFVVSRTRRGAGLGGGSAACRRFHSFS